MKEIKVILYDAENMTYREGYLESCESNTISNRQELLNGTYINIVHGYTDTIICQHNGEKQSIELEPTTMKRILKYNKEVEIEKLNKEIENKKKEIKELDDKLKDKEKRWEKVKQYIANIYDLNLEENYDEDCDW